MDNIATEAEPEPKDRSNRYATWIGLTVLGLWTVWLLGLGRWLASTFGPGTGGDAAAISAAAGQFGDLFGGLNALFTAMAFGAVAWSAFSQRHEMAMQRREMAMQRREMGMQREQLDLQRQALKDQEREMAEQRKVFQQQAFESTFFQMLGQCRDLHREVRADGSIGDDAWRILGPSCGQLIKSAHGRQHVRELIGSWYESNIYTGETRQTLGSYFRCLYHLFKLIDAQGALSPAHRRRYANIARAHLRATDLAVLAANGCSEAGAGFRPYIEAFGLLKHMERGELQAKVLVDCYSPSAFVGFNE